jgi:hypothetical protein
MNSEDLDLLVVKFRKSSSAAESAFDEELRTVQDHAYKVGLERGIMSESINLIANYNLMLAALRRAALALAFASETSPAMGDDYKAVSDVIETVTKGTE